MMVAGSVSHSMTGRKDPPTTFDGVEEKNLYVFHLFAPFAGVRIASVSASATACHYVALAEGGDAWVWGRNERGALGLGHQRNIFQPERLQDAVAGLGACAGAAVGRAHTLVLARDGCVWSAGESKLAQTGLGERDTPVLKATRVADNAGFLQHFPRFVADLRTQHSLATFQ